MFMQAKLLMSHNKKYWTEIKTLKVVFDNMISESSKPFRCIFGVNLSEVNVTILVEGMHLAHWCVHAHSNRAYLHFYHLNQYLLSIVAVGPKYCKGCVRS